MWVISLPYAVTERVGRDIIHIYLLYMFHVVTVIILFCKHWGSNSAFKFLNIWTYVL